MWLWYSGSLRQPLGVFDRPSDVPWADSVRIGDGDVQSGLRKVTEFVNWLDKSKPGLGDFFSIFS